MMEAVMQRRTFLNGLAGMGAVYSMSALNPPQYIPKESKEKWVVVFGTWCGSTRDAAVWISEGMGGIAAVFDARQKPDLKAFDHVLVGTAIHGGRGPQELDDLLKSSLPDLKGKIRGYYAVCGNGGDRPGAEAQRNYIDNYLAKICQTPAPMNRVFPGRITKALLPQSDIDRLEEFFKQQNMPFEDYDHLARWDCLQFGRQILRAASAPAKKA